MNLQTITNSGMILAGAIIMLISIFKARNIIQATLFVHQNQRKKIRHLLAFHRGLMFLFLTGYIAVMIAFALGDSILSKTFVSVIFFFGAVFVFIGIAVQFRLLSEIQNTLHGILPICVECKKIRAFEGDHSDTNSWQKIEAYISKRVAVNFSHGYCPACFEKKMKHMDEACTPIKTNEV